MPIVKIYRKAVINQEGIALRPLYLSEEAPAETTAALPEFFE
jgi:hypothetical protein